jgi:hypothetical protein
MIAHDFSWGQLEALRKLENAFKVCEEMHLVFCGIENGLVVCIDSDNARKLACEWLVTNSIRVNTGKCYLDSGCG